MNSSGAISVTSCLVLSLVLALCFDFNSELNRVSSEETKLKGYCKLTTNLFYQIDNRSGSIMHQVHEIHNQKQRCKE